jgi:hypothetical protein
VDALTAVWKKAFCRKGILKRLYEESKKKERGEKLPVTKG